MGYIKHHAIIVTAWDDAAIEAAHIAAEESGALVSPISASGTNGYRSFCVFPDGSKEGWEASMDGDTRREDIIRFLREQAEGNDGHACEWCEVSYGHDDERAAVTRSAWNALERDA